LFSATALLKDHDAARTTTGLSTPQEQALDIMETDFVGWVRRT